MEYRSRTSELCLEPGESQSMSRFFRARSFRVSGAPSLVRSALSPRSLWSRMRRAISRHVYGGLAIELSSQACVSVMSVGLAYELFLSRHSSLSRRPSLFWCGCSSARTLARRASSSLEWRRLASKSLACMCPALGRE